MLHARTHLRLATAFLLAAAPLGAAQPDPLAGLSAAQLPAGRTKVLVLGTFHLRGQAEKLKPEMFDGLIAALEKFHPSAICVETLPGARVRELELRRDANPLNGQVVEMFAGAHVKLGSRAGEVLGTTPEKAAAKVRELLAKGAGTTAEDRARLALWMLAAYEPASAVLQWSTLDAAEKEAQKAVPADLAAKLDEQAARMDEIPVIGARLARRLGLKTLEAVDDFEDPDAYAVIDEQLDKDTEGNAMLAAVSKARVYTDAAAHLAQCEKGGDLLPHYALMNSAKYERDDVDAQWGVYLRTHFASGSDRTRLGLWENRNLKIAARIRAVAALHPGGRVLVIYGAAHRPFLEAYLSRAADVEVVGFGERNGGR